MLTKFVLLCLIIAVVSRCYQWHQKKKETIQKSPSEKFSFSFCLKCIYLCKHNNSAISIAAASEICCFNDNNKPYPC